MLYIDTFRRKYLHRKSHHNIITFSRPVFRFQHFAYILRKTHPCGAAKAKFYISNSLYCITSGGNDIAAYIANSTFQNTTSPQQFVSLLISKFDQYIQGLYPVGAKEFLVVDTPPVGCTPYTKYVGYSIAKSACLEPANHLAVAYNTALKSLLDNLTRRLAGVVIIHLRSYDYFINIIENPEAYGFKDASSACCGSGMFNAQVSCGKTLPENMYCNDTSAYVWLYVIKEVELKKTKRKFSEQ